MLGSCPESLWSLHLGRNTKSNWTDLGATSLHDSALSKGEAVERLM